LDEAQPNLFQSHPLLLPLLTPLLLLLLKSTSFNNNSLQKTLLLLLLLLLQRRKSKSKKTTRPLNNLLNNLLNNNNNNNNNSLLKWTVLRSEDQLNPPHQNPSPKDNKILHSFQLSEAPLRTSIHSVLEWDD